MPTPTRVYPADMLAARLHGPSDLRLERVPHPGPPGAGEVLLRVTVTGICGSDLHSYPDARIGDTPIRSPLILGHEFSGVVEEVGAGRGRRRSSSRCGRARGWPWIRPSPAAAASCASRATPTCAASCGSAATIPYDGSLCQWMHMPARLLLPGAGQRRSTSRRRCWSRWAWRSTRSTWPGSAWRTAWRSWAPARSACASCRSPGWPEPIRFSSCDQFPWRLAAGRATGRHCRSRAERATGVTRSTSSCARRTAGAWMWPSRRPGGTSRSSRRPRWRGWAGGVVLVGSRPTTGWRMKHSTARRKGLTILMSRRMKHCYPRAISLAERGRGGSARLGQPPISACRGRRRRLP